MATVAKLTRVFRYNGLSLPDLNPAATPEKIRELYARQSYPELQSAEIEGPKTEGENLVFTMVRAVRSKGGV